MSRNGMLVRIALALAAAAALATVAVSAAGAARQSATLHGDGSTFVAPLVNTWIPHVHSSLGITVTYPAAPAGSGGGVTAITNKTVDFGASDAPLASFATTCHTCTQTPWALSGTAIIYNLNGFPGLHMTGSVLAQIYLGKITFWDNKAIKAINPGKKLPHTQIIPVERNKASGTTYNFTDFLSRTSSAWKNGPGTSTYPAWPAGTQASGSLGVASTVATNPGGIGYVDLYYGIKNHLSYMFIQNRSKHWVQPTFKSISAAAAYDTHPDANGAASIVNPPASTKYFGAYPISTYTYVDVQTSSGSQATPLKAFLNWAVTTGQSFAKADYFVPLPKTVVTFDKKQIAKIH